MRILTWSMDSGLKESAERDYRTAFALSLKDKDSLTIMRTLTFDGAAPAITVADIEGLFDFTERAVVGKRIEGVGCEVGAGAGVFSAILSKRPDISQMYAVEVCAPLVTELMPRVVSAIAGPHADKVIGCVGDFNNLEIPDGSIDFIFDFFSLHHSADIGVTLAGCRRVLRRGGILVALDKARPDSMTDADRARMLDKEYDDAYKKQFGIPLTRRLSRRDNGEHEYRLKDWQAAFASAGFSRFRHVRLDTPTGGPFIMRVLKKCIAILPFRVQPFFSCILPHGNDLFDLSWNNRVFTSSVSHFRKEMSLMVGYAD